MTVSTRRYCTLLLVAQLAILAPVTAAATELARQTLLSGGLTRSYQLHVPERVATGPAPALVIVLHGAGGSAQNALEQGRWIEKSDAAGFVVLAPDGKEEKESRRSSLFGNPRTWNAGPQSGTPAELRGVNDVGYVRDLIDAMLRQGPVDPEKAADAYLEDDILHVTQPRKRDAQIKAIAGWPYGHIEAYGKRR